MAAMSCLKLYTATSGDAAANLDIPDDGEIECIAMDLQVNGADALNDGVALEVSFASVSGFTANDTRASLLTIAAYQGFLTSGGGSVAKFGSVSGLAIPVSAGERIYIHTAVNGTITFAARVYLYVSFTGGRPSARRRAT